jgi:hypothetical protein
MPSSGSRIKVDSQIDNVKSINITESFNTANISNMEFEVEIKKKPRKNAKKDKAESEVDTMDTMDAVANASGPQATLILPKRRGRKPKKMLDQPTKPIDFELLEKQDDTIITLHLPINLKKGDSDSKDNVKKKSKSKSPKSPKSMSASCSDSDDSTDDIFGKNDTSEEAPCHSCIDRDQIIKYQKQQIVDMEMELKKEKRERKAYYVNVNMFDVTSGKPVLVQKTNNACMWDCNTFETMPCFLPELYYQNSYYVRAVCFCSFNCVMAYNIYQLNDGKVSERKSLVLAICRKIYQTNEIEINEAPPRESLRMFGGVKSIEEFRAESKTMNKKYMVLLPPIQPLFPIVQEDCCDGSKIEQKQDKSKFTLQRTTPLIKNNSLVSSMGLTIKKSNK